MNTQATRRRGMSEEQIAKQRALLASHEEARVKRNKQAQMLARPEIGGRLQVMPDGNLKVFFSRLPDAEGNSQGGSYDAFTGVWESDGATKFSSVDKLKEAVNLLIKKAMEKK